MKGLFQVCESIKQEGETPVNHSIPLEERGKVYCAWALTEGLTIKC